MPVARQLRLCCPFLSHNTNFLMIPGYTYLINLPQTQLSCDSGVPCSHQCLALVEEAPTVVSDNIVTHIQSNDVQGAILFRRHRGGKVKNKLRNIEKRKKREQNIQKISSDVKFN